MTRSGRLFAVGMMCFGFCPGYAVGDSYLDLVDEEATKVEARSTDKGPDGAENQADDLRRSASRERFEALLEQRHVGTFSIYRRLPERSRQEVFRDYRNGASIEALREKIVDRYLHP